MQSDSLPWLPAAPADFTAQTAKGTVLDGLALRHLATHQLDTNQLTRLARLLSAHRADGADLLPLIPMTLGIVSHTTMQLAAPCIAATALRHGIDLRIIETEFNQVAHEAFSDGSAFTGHKLDALLVALDYRSLPLTESPGDAVKAEETLTNCMAHIDRIVQQLQKKTGAMILLQNLVPPVELAFGSFEARTPGTLPWLLRQLNMRIDTLASSTIIIVDVESQANRIGLEAWHDAKLWHMAKLAFSQKYIPLYAESICRILGAMRGKSRRCLILDLDNTLWGGVIGDDGMDGIAIGNGDAVGEAHLAIQRLALSLRNRGIVLAVCSKNEDATARRVFREHPDMVLREEHIAVFQANWIDKATNIRAIADNLSLGLESMVFLDDNPAERMQVRRELPQVAVPELPADVSYYARTLVAAGYFEAIAFSDEDRQRANFYQGNAQRSALMEQASDMDGYLKSLNMQIHFQPFDNAGRARIAQLISKSNQFNLTTRRYSEAEVAALEINSRMFTRQIRLSDALGDNGMISVVICEKMSDHWRIDTWLMSCRVLGRKVEEAALQEMIAHARSEGATHLIGHYIPTERNIIVKDHYEKLGFTKVADDASNQTWRLEITDITRPEIPMSVVH